jgi:tetratricopeptide (TPR) repeat protein
MRIVGVFLALFLAFAAPATHAESVRSQTLDRLFAVLHTTGDIQEATRLTSLIWAVWNHADDPETDRLLTEGREAMQGLELEKALACFNKVIERDPNFPEGWNKRATLYYVMGDYRASIKDIREVLAREPRHFGALAGLGMNYEALGDDAAALNAWRRALKANPHLQDAQARIKALETTLMNRPI